MEVHEIAKSIIDKIERLETGIGLLDTRGKEKAESLVAYRKQLGIIAIKLRNGDQIQLEGEFIQNPPATTIPIISKAVCFKEKLDAEMSETIYRNTIIKIDAIKAIMNALQSINKNLAEV